MRYGVRWLSFIAALFLASVASAQNTFFYVNKGVGSPNSVIGYSLNYDGSFTTVGTFPTGGTGNSIYFASNRIVVGGSLNSCLYVSNDASNTITAFKINTIAGSLSLTQTFSSGGTAGFGISLAATADGSWLYAANAGSNNVVGFQIDPSAIGACDVAALPFPPVTVLGGPDGTKTTADAGYLFVASPSVGPHGSLYWFSIDPSTGALTPGPGSPMSVRSTGPAGVATGVDISCSEDTVAIGEANVNSPPDPTLIVDWFNFNPTTGSLTPGSGSPITGTSSVNTNVVQFSADDLNLFVPGVFDGNVSSFSTNPFTFQSATPSGAGAIHNLAVDGSGQFVVTANPGSASSYIRRLRGDLDQEQLTSIADPTRLQSVAIWPPKCNN